jgi:hypothetical protein
MRARWAKPICWVTLPYCHISVPGMLDPGVVLRVRRSELLMIDQPTPGGVL